MFILLSSLIYQWLFLSHLSMSTALLSQQKTRPVLYFLIFFNIFVILVNITRIFVGMMGLYTETMNGSLSNYQTQFFLAFTALYYIIFGFIFLFYGFLLKARLIKYKYKYGFSVYEEPILSPKERTAPNEQSTDHTGIRGFLIFIFALVQSVTLTFGLIAEYHTTSEFVEFGIVDSALFFVLLGIFSKNVTLLQSLSTSSALISSPPAEDPNRKVISSDSYPKSKSTTRIGKYNMEEHKNALRKPIVIDSTGSQGESVQKDDISVNEQKAISVNEQKGILQETTDIADTTGTTPQMDGDYFF